MSLSPRSVPRALAKTATFMLFIALPAAPVDRFPLSSPTLVGSFWGPASSLPLTAVTLPFACLASALLQQKGMVSAISSARMVFPSVLRRSTYRHVASLTHSKGTSSMCNAYSCSCTALPTNGPPHLSTIPASSAMPRLGAQSTAGAPLAVAAASQKTPMTMCTPCLDILSSTAATSS
jgi:hypothetical protein